MATGSAAEAKEATATKSESSSNSLLKNVDNIRNICILAHVDHGKTTLADSLIASNGVISSRLAGKLRYMDSRRDEQERGITMKSSSIALYHKTAEAGGEFLINLIDSPGHVDFSAEVSTATRLCDGALVVVDVVEGVCPQTRSALRHAWAEKIKPLLVLNKVDRLIAETKTSPLDAYLKLCQIVEQINSVVGDLFRSDVLEKTENERADDSATAATTTTNDWSAGLEEADDSNVYFSPEQGNVIFASAIDGWGFTVQDFARILARKLGFSENMLRKTLWGNYYLDAKSKRVLKGAHEKAKKPLFVHMILESLWSAYETITVLKDKQKTASMIERLGVDVKPSQLRWADAGSVVKTVLGRWMPLADAVLNAVCVRLPAPNALTDEKVETLMSGPRYAKRVGPETTTTLKSWFAKCSSAPDAPVIVFVSKMFPVERKHLPENRTKPLTPEEMNARREAAKQRLATNEAGNQVTSRPETIDETEDEQVFIAFARIYSGCVRPGREVFVLGPKHDPITIMQRIKNGEYDVDATKTLKDLKADEHVTKTKIGRLYLLMGRALEPLNEVPAGNVFGIAGLEEHVLKSATLSTELACPAFSELHLMATPILRVAVEPENPAHLGRLTQGLKLLNQADASVQVLVQETGEQVLVTTGEVHLQRCVEDLREIYAKVPILVSEPIVPYRETVVPLPKVDMVNEAIKERENDGRANDVTVRTADGVCSVKLNAVPLPPDVTEYLEKYADLIKFAASLTASDDERQLATQMRSSCSVGGGGEKTDALGTKFTGLSADIETEIVEMKNRLSEALGRINVDVETVWSFGPRQCGPNMLINACGGDCAAGKMSFWNWPTDTNSVYAKYESNFLSGFQMATLAGPLCEEPMMGVAFAVSEWRINESETTSVSTYGPFSGQLITAVADGCRRAFQAQPQRLMAAMYTCNISANSEVLGRMYALLGKRHGRVVHGDLEAGSGATFTITAYLPVAESFAFASEVRKQTSGLANPQLVFSHWEVIDVDPFWRPNTEEEYLLYGEKADSENYARLCMNRVRKRKGLATDEKLVEHAEKQRTLSKNK